ncbi:MAG: nuclear transport factor 2 family protein [Chthoniobacterales bacterium]
MKTSLNNYKLALLAGACLVLSVDHSAAENPAPDAAAITATVESFHKALAAGKPDEVMSLLQPDALIVEGGSVETRAEYESGHLGEDIAYARAVPGKQLKAVVRQEGDAAWVTSTFSVVGVFQGRSVNSLAAETMVLTKAAAGWRICAIHWSSHKAAKSQTGSAK